MQGLDLVPAFLPSLIDVDTEGDLRRWLQAHGAGESRLVTYLRRHLDR